MPAVTRFAPRGSPADYEDWVARGNEGWSFEEVLPYFRQLEADADALFGVDRASLQRHACTVAVRRGLTIIAGGPGTGKTSLQRWWLCQLAPHPAVQIAVLDGKVFDPADGDYGLLLSRCFAAAGGS